MPLSTDAQRFDKSLPNSCAAIDKIPSDLERRAVFLIFFR